MEAAGRSIEVFLGHLHAWLTLVIPVIGTGIDAALAYPLGNSWTCTLSRTVLLLAGIMTIRATRRYPWLRSGISLSVALLTLRVLADLISGHGASTPYTVYAAGGNLAPLIFYVGAARMATLFDRVTRDRQAARAMVREYQRQLGEPLTDWNQTVKEKA